MSGGTVLVCDVHDASPPTGLLRVMVESFPDQTVFLPLDDPVFASGGVLQYPLAHRLPLP